MTQSLNLRNIAAVSAVAVTAFVAVAASSGQASAAKSVLYCEGASRQSVRECCETLVKQNGLPLWMRQTGRNCTTSVRCYPNGPTFGAPTKICRIVAYYEEESHSKGRGRGRKGP